MARRPTDVFTFDDETHTYRLGSRILPGVTDVLGDLIDYSHIGRYILERKRQIGQALHRAIELGGELDPGSLDPAVEPYYRAWEKFQRDTEFHIVEQEQRGYHKLYRYAGTWDLVGEFARPRSPLVLVDVKTLYELSPVSGLQTAAYAAIRDQHQRRKIQQRYTLQLKNDGTYRLEGHDQRDDLAVFLACLQRYQWIQKTGVKR